MTVDEINFDLSERGTTDAVHILRWMQIEYRAKGKKLYMCCVNLVKSFHIVPRKVLKWAMRKKGIPDIIVRSVMSLYK